MSASEEFWEVDKPGNFNNKGGRYMKFNPKEENGYSVDEIKRLAERVRGMAVKVISEAAEDAEDIAAAREARKEPGRIPNYYLMPNCIEVKEIARYLTSNGGQAVQYIARATRTDGIIKGNPISDLEKARDMIEDEINRLKETN